MDIDMSLDDLAAKNKTPSSNRGGPARRGRSVSGGSSRGGRGGERPAAVPYNRPPPASTNAPWRHDMFGAKGGRPTLARPASSQTNPTAKLRIEGLHYEIQNFQLEKIFAQAGQIAQGPSIVYDRSGRSTGVATVTYAAISDAKLALEKLNGQKANGEPISITYIPVSLPRHGTGRVDGLTAGKPLLGRLGGLTEGANLGAPAVTRAREARAAKNGNAPARGAGPVSERGARGGRGKGEGGRGAKGGKRGPVDQDALDKELEAFMKTDAPASTAAAPEAAAMEE